MKNQSSAKTLAKKYRALVIHSGGMDSSICLKQAITQDFHPEEVLAVSFFYHQKHQRELVQAKKIAQDWSVDHREFHIDLPQFVSRSSLINNSSGSSETSTHQPAQVPSSFVPGRNGLLLRLASMIAWEVSADTLYLGVLGLESERSGYPDCTREYIDLQEKSFQLDYFNPQFKVITPLIHLTKQQSYALAQGWGCLEYLLEETITCYEGIAKIGCGQCPACQLRNQSLREYLKNKLEVQFSYRQELMES